MEFSTRSMHKILESQTGKRVSQPAANQLGQKLEQITSTIAEQAVKTAQEDGYQTVKAKHIRQALHNRSKFEYTHKYKSAEI